MSKQAEWGRLGYLKSKEKREENILKKKIEYENNPILCSYCNVKIPYEKCRYRLNDRKKNPNSKSYCSHRCSATSNNKNRTNAGFPKKDKTKNLIEIKKAEEKEKFFNNEIQISSHRAKRFIIEKFGKQCQDSCCAWDMNKRDIGLEIDHIDGNSSNNYFSNLRVLCPNCHSLTPTYKAKNYGNGRAKRKYYDRKLNAKILASDIGE